MTATHHPEVSRTYGSVERPTWRSWPDWVNIGLGAYLALATIWTVGAPAAWFITLGLLIVVVGLWAEGTASSSGAEWTQGILGAVTILAPWLGGFAGTPGAAWTAWIIGAALVVLAAVARSRRTRVA